MNAASGVFTWTAATAVNGTFTQTCGFQPQVILFFSAGNSSATDAGSTTLHKRQNFGVVTRDGSTLVRWCVAAIARDGNTTMNTGRIKRTDAIVATANPDDVTGEMDLESLLDIDAVANWPADGFRVIVDDQGAVDNRVQWLAWGGDVTNVASGELTEPGATGNQDITSPGFQPDLVILGTIMGTATGNEGPLSHSSICVGFISPDGQYTHWTTSEDALGTAITKRYGVPVECLAMDNLTNQELDGRAEGSMLSTGFRLNWLERTGSRKAFWTAIKGGGYSLQSFLIPTGVAATITATFGFEPRGIMVIGHIDTGQSAQDSPNDHDATGIGFGTSTSNRTSQFVHDTHAATIGAIRQRIEHDAIYCEGDTTLGSALDIDAILSTGVRFINDDPPGGDLFVATLGIGDTLSAPAANFAAAVSLALTTVSAFTTSITAAGTVAASLTTAGAFTTVIAFAGSASLALTVAADLTAEGVVSLVRYTYLGPHGVPLGRQPLPPAELAGAASLAVTATADLTAAIPTFAAAVSATVTTAAALTTSIPLAGAATGSATTAGALTTVIRFAGAATATVTTTGVLTTVIRAAGAATATITTAGALTTAIPFAGASTVTVTTAGALTTVISPRGAASLVLSAQGALQTEIRLAATAQLVLTTQPTMAGTSANFAAAPSLTVTATGSLTTVIRAAATATLSLTTSPALTTVIPLAGAATATLTTAPAVLTTPTGFRAAVTATLTTTGGLTTQIRMAGTASLVLTTAGQIGSEALLASAVQLRITTAGDIATALLLASQVTATLAAAGALTTAITLVGESTLLVTAIGDFTVTVQPVGDGWIFHLEPVRSHFTVPESDHVARVLAGAHVFDAKDQGDET